MKFFKELRERRLFQILVAYIGAGWALLQVVDQLADRGIIPALLYTITLTWYVLGIPATLMIGWNHGEKGKQRAPMTEIFVLVLLCLTGLGFSGRTVQEHLAMKKIADSAANPLEMRSIAVRYFADRSADGEYTYLADGLTEALIEELQQVRGLDVVSRNGSAQFRGEDVPTDSMAAALKVGTVVQGEIEAHGEELEITLELVDGPSGVSIPGTRVKLTEPVADLATMRESVVKEAARVLRTYLGSEVRVRESARRTASNAAWLQLQRAEKTRKDAEAALLSGDVTVSGQLFARADTLLASAAAADDEWADPWAERAAIAYRRARLAQSNPVQAVAYAGEALKHAERALELERTHARALEIRGTARYYQFLLQVETDPDAQAALLASAQQDLEAAAQYDPTLATAHATLSHLYMRQNISDAVLAATRAYEQDAWLEAADVVLWRLFGGSLELENFGKARQWCEEGARRFVADYRFLSCQLRLMVTPGTQPDVTKAWQLLARQDSLLPPARKAFEHARGELTVGGVIARAGMADSAKSVLNRVARTITRELDPTQELVAAEAYMRVLTGEDDRAVDLLSQFAAGNPQVLESTRGEVQWWWRDLQDNPRFRRLIGLQ